MGSVGIKWGQIKNYAYFQIKYGSNYIIGKKRDKMGLFTKFFRGIYVGTSVKRSYTRKQ